MTSEYWQKQETASGSNEFNCPWCDRTLKPKVSKSAKNPNKVFVGCNKDYGGCGLFSWIDDKPDDRFKPKAGGTKRAREEGGNNVIGPIADKPSAHEERLADLAAKIDQLNTNHAEAMEILRGIKAYLEQ